MTQIVFDFDPLLYSCGPLAEERYVLVENTSTKEQWKVKSRSEFYGHWKKKQGGLLAQMNEGRFSPLDPERDFTYIDVQEPTKFKWATNGVDAFIERVCGVLGTNDYYGYTGRGKVFRHDLATLHPYKHGRDAALKPLFINELKEYLVKWHGGKIVEGIEADDAVTMDSYAAFQEWKAGKREPLIAAILEKDYRCGPIHMYNTSEDTLDTIDGFGKLWVQTNVSPKGKTTRQVKGEGRIWLIFQCLSGDDADTYWANSGCLEKPWGEMSAYKMLCECKTDKEAFQALMDGYKHLYPEPKQFTNFRGDTFTIDALYCASENFSLAKMLRWEGDHVKLKDVLTKLNISY